MTATWSTRISRAPPRPRASPTQASPSCTAVSGPPPAPRSHSASSQGAKPSLVLPPPSEMRIPTSTSNRRSRRSAALRVGSACAPRLRASASRASARTPNRTSPAAPTPTVRRSARLLASSCVTSRARAAAASTTTTLSTRTWRARGRPIPRSPRASEWSRTTARARTPARAPLDRTTTACQRLLSSGSASPPACSASRSHASSSTAASAHAPTKTTSRDPTPTPTTSQRRIRYHATARRRMTRFRSLRSRRGPTSTPTTP
mmetsp:Transcript_27141/g.52835  ORF Transcript_27141/g.52835 Transcript_27141/m.52835 type:complete len:261 (-) Transcript_27141:839-1621(-)